MEEYGYEGVTILPRHAINYAFSVPTTESLTEWYNKEKRCGASQGQKCKEGEYTYADIVLRYSTKEPTLLSACSKKD